MKQFDFYEFTGILVPGVAALAGILLLYPAAFKPEFIKDFSVGGLGLFVVLAYVLGHLVQAVGNAVESAWWKAFGGMPTDWVRSKPDSLLAPAQVTALEQTAKERLNMPDLQIGQCSKGQWYGLTRQIHADVAAAGRVSRVEIFNGNYGLNRGIGSGLLVALVTSLFQTPINWTFVGLVATAAGLALYRMHRFARHYARELFVQFLQLPAQDTNKEKSS